jgi:hypothetical protein
MNNMAIGASMLVLMASPAIAANSVEESRSWTETFAVSSASPMLEISNIWGDVRVSAGRPGEITVNISEHRVAPDQRRFERSKEFLQLNTEAGEDGVSMWVGEREQSWGRGNRCRGCRAEYRFDVYVPAGAQLDVSTVNDGEVEISGVSGPVIAGNVNGSVTVSGLDNCTSLETVNGEVAARFAHPPRDDCDIETVNGDIVLTMPAKAGLNMAMDLFNGRLKSELPVDALAIPARVEERRFDGGYLYRVEQAAGVRVAGGGPTFSVSSINGDVRIQKAQ